jgi:hypothetical protein
MLRNQAFLRLLRLLRLLRYFLHQYNQAYPKLSKELIKKVNGMNILAHKPLAKTLEFDSNMMWVDLIDGRKLGVPLAYFPRLLNATLEQCQSYEISGGGSGLHWDEIDEDINVEDLLMGIADRTHSYSHSERLAA